MQGSNYAQFGHPVFNAETIKFTKMCKFKDLKHQNGSKKSN
jgi:hypothetical protein